MFGCLLLSLFPSLSFSLPFLPLDHRFYGDRGDKVKEHGFAVTYSSDHDNEGDDDDDDE